MKITREQFEYEFTRINASWALEDLEIDPEGKEQIRQVIMGEISKLEFDQWVFNKRQGG